MRNIPFVDLKAGFAPIKHDVMKALDIKPGPEVGKILNRLFKEVVEKKVPNEKKVLLKKIKEIS